jgi:ABC-type polysaccharide/polyol phosphate transport system ATPase subunit
MSLVRFDRVSKRFTLHRERSRSFQELFLGLIHRQRRPTKEEFWALQDVSLDVGEGEMVGIVGPNGAGKSTILKLISRIIEPTSGTIEVNGRVGALLELGTGFHPDLTGRENVYLNGSVVGLGRREIDRLMDEIIGFSEMERFIDVPVKHYSSGMFMRLGFSVAVHIRPNILLVDEVLAVGDHAFQLRCLDRIQEMKRRGVTILLVTHDTDQVHELCDRAVWLDGGRIRAQGVVDYVLEAYLTEARAADAQALIRSETAIRDSGPDKWSGTAPYSAKLDMESRATADEAAPDKVSGEAPGGAPSDGPSGTSRRWGTREGEIVNVQLVDGCGREQRSFKTGDPFVVRIHYLAHQRIERPHFGIGLDSANGLHISGPNTNFSGFDIEAIEGAGSIEYVIDRLPLLAGSYLLSTSLYDYDGLYAYDHHHQAYGFRVYQDETRQERYGTVVIPSHWRMRTPGDER